ncbi:MAG: hypothetical protein AAFU65_03685 [Pseudomonadota bacterium]
MQHRRPPRKPLVIAKAARRDVPNLAPVALGLLLLGLLLIGVQAGGVM